MDISGLDLQKLQYLHLAYQGVLGDHTHQLETLAKSGDTPDIVLSALQQKIDFFEAQISSIEQRINELSKKQLRFSVEYLFWNFGLTKRSLQIEFLSPSIAYKTYGPFVTGVLIFDDNQIQGLIDRVKKEENNDGVIKFEETASITMNPETMQRLLTEGFKASEIDKIAWL